MNIERVWICRADGSHFTEHVLDPNKIIETTFCSLTWEDAPKNDWPIKTLKMAPELADERNWFTDHDRDDVIKCAVCFETTFKVLFNN